VILLIHKLYFNNPGERVFHIQFGRRRIVEDVDIVKEVGKYAAYTIYIEFKLENGLVYVDDLVCPRAYNDVKKVLKIVFEKGPADNPKVDSILLYKAPKQCKVS
jgi:hypothetical protein